MDYKKTKAPTTCITRDVVEMADKTGNVYDPSRSVSAKRTTARMVARISSRSTRVRMAWQLHARPVR